MEERREVFDASVHMLFEATGDSESLYSDAAESDAAEDDADDAQSCSYYRSSSARVHGGDEIRGADLDYLSGDDDEDEDGVVDQCRIRRLKAAAEPPVKSKGCDESSNVRMMMNESREGDKLFWEACLAS